MTRFVIPVAQVGAGIQIADGAKLYFYETKTRNPLNVYSDAEMTIAHTQPVVADENGFFPDIFYAATYKVILDNKVDNQQYEWDPVSGFIENPTEQLPYFVNGIVGDNGQENLPSAATYTWGDGTIDATATSFTVGITRASVGDSEGGNPN